MAFTVESAQLTARISREILIIENQPGQNSALLATDAVHTALQPLLHLVERHYGSIGSMHVLDIVTRLVGISRSANTKQIIVGFGLCALIRLVDDSESTMRLKECSSGLKQLLSMVNSIVSCAGVAQCDRRCPELIRGICMCEPILVSEHVDVETKECVVKLLRAFIVKGIAPNAPKEQEDEYHTALKLYCTLSNEFQSLFTALRSGLSTSADMDTFVLLFVTLHGELTRDELDDAVEKAVEGIFALATLAQPQTVLQLAELLADLEDARVTDLFRVLLDNVIAVSAPYSDAIIPLQSLVMNNALAHSNQKVEPNRETLDFLVSYLTAGDGKLREDLGMYILDSLFALLILPESRTGNTEVRILLYMYALEKTHLLDTVMYSDALYMWIEARAGEYSIIELPQDTYWYNIEALICKTTSETASTQHQKQQQSKFEIDKDSTEVTPFLQILGIVARNINSTMLCKAIEALKKEAIIKCLFLSEALLANESIVENKLLVEALLIEMNILIHVPRIPMIECAARQLLDKELHKKSIDDVQEALLYMMCVFYNISSHIPSVFRSKLRDYATIAIEHIGTALFGTFYVATDSFNLSLKSLLAVLIVALHYVSASSLPLITGIRDTLINRWNKILVSEGPRFSQTNICLYTALLNIVLYGTREAAPSIDILNMQLQIFPDPSLFQELPSMNYYQDLTEEGFNRYNDGENIAVLTPFGHALLIDDLEAEGAKISASHLSVVSFFGDSLALILPIVMRGLNDATDGRQELDTAMLSLYESARDIIKNAMSLYYYLVFPLPYKLAYRMDPYHNAMMPRGYKSNEPRAEDSTYNTLLALRLKASSLYVDEAGKTRLQAADADWLSLFRDGKSAARVIIHNCFDAFFYRAQQATASRNDRLHVLNGLLFASTLFELDAEYLQSKREPVYIALHRLLFFTSIISLPHIAYISQWIGQVPDLKLTLAEIAPFMQHDTHQTQEVIAYMQTDTLLSRLTLVCAQLTEKIGQTMSRFAPPVMFLDIVSFFMCMHHSEDVKALASTMLSTLFERYVYWQQEECPAEETIEGAAERLPIYVDGVQINQGDVLEWAMEVLDTRYMFDEYCSLDVKSEESAVTINLKRWLSITMWPLSSHTQSSTLAILGGSHDAQTFIEGANQNIECKRKCMYVLIHRNLHHLLQTFVNGKKREGKT